MGGLEVHTWELARHLAKDGHSVDLIAWQPLSHERLPAEVESEGVRVHRLHDWRFKYYWWPAFRLANKLHADNPFDVIHAHTSFPAGLGGAMLSVRRGVPLVITSHGAEIMKPAGGRAATMLRDLIVRLVFMRARAVIGVSRELVDLSIEFGAHPDRTTYMANATDIEKFHPAGNGTAIRERYGIGAEDVVVMSLRRLTLKTGVYYIVEAARELVADYPALKFLILGTGEEKAGLISKVEEYGMSDRFIFAGEIDNTEVPSYIAAADMAVFPSLAEATSIACLEIMACGRPVVVSNIGGLPEIVDDGKTGLIVDFQTNAVSSYQDWGLSEETISELAGAIGRLVKDEPLRKELGRNAAARVRSEFAWESYIGRMKSVYGQAIGEK
jgi:glycosyltransferase involved in cell wall biosynthesis